MDHSETIGALAKITDEGLFERLATAVLRQAEPGLYAKLSHPGMNPAGRTKPSPVDGIGFVTSDDLPHMVIAHHTIASLRELKRKWLNNPAKAKKGDSKTAAVLGDVVKTNQIVKEERERTPSLRVTLALTSNQDPSENLIRDVQAVANLHRITIDVWPVSRIAHYLDNTPDGQWLRRQYLGISQERISADLLAELSRLSLDSFNMMPATETLIERDFDAIVASRSPLPVAFFIGESGFGKTVACYTFLKKHIDSGGYGLWLSHNTVEACPTLDQALDSELRRLHPSLEPFAGGKARGFCSPDKPFVVLVEDINWSERPSLLLERLIGWSGAESNTVARFNWRVLCPVWPRTIATTSTDARKRLDSLSVTVKPFTVDEARHAVRQRARLARIDINDLTADRIADALGNDPLLIGLYDFSGERDHSKVIETFVSNSIQRLGAGTGSFIYTEYQDALRQLAREMLVQRQIAPTWRDITEWLAGQPDRFAAIRQIVQTGEIVRLGITTQLERLRFRHDRVRAWLLSEAMAELMRANLAEDTIIAEPFYADVIGSALTYPHTTVRMVERVRDKNPLALFYALKAFGEPQTEVHEAVVQAIYGWLREDEMYKRPNRALRSAILDVLSETESSQVIPITNHLRDGMRSRITARFLNGDLAAGVQLCLNVDPRMTATWRDREIEHAKHRFGNALIDQLIALLNQTKLKDGVRIGALRLAGHLAEPALSSAILKCWLRDKRRKKHLVEYLWAAAHCGGDNPGKLLKPMCAAWATLSNKVTELGRTPPREMLGVRDLFHVFKKDLSQPATRYFVGRARSKDLRLPIMLMLRGIDQPEALKFVVRLIAEESRSGRDGWFLLNNMDRDWERRQLELGQPMSNFARRELLTLWKGRNDKYIRKAAFRLWAATIAEDDLVVLRNVDDNELEESILWARMRRGDVTAIPAWADKLRGDHLGYWWQLGRYFWNEDLTAELDNELNRRSQQTTQEWDSDYDSDWIVTELLLTRLAPEQTEVLMQKHWEHLRFSYDFIEAALLTATRTTCSLAGEAVAASPDPRSIFKFAGLNLYPQYKNGPGMNRLEQARAFLPYLDYLDDFAIGTLWDTCNRLGWFTFRRSHLDNRLGGTHRSNTILDERAFFRNLDEVLRQHDADWAYFFIDRYMKQTDRFEEVLALVEKWLKERMSLAAFDAVAAVLRHVGGRQNLKLLELEGIQPADKVEEIRRDTYFAVARHSLG